MPNKDGTLTLQELKKLVMPGLSKVESDGRSRLINKTPQNGGVGTFALGEYQFLPRWHWNAIVDFNNSHPTHKNRPLTKISKNNLKTSSSEKQYDLFLRNTSLQKDYMEHYISTKYNEVKNLYKRYGNNNNVRMDEIFAMVHHQGSEAATNALSSGKINYKSLDGTGGDVYLKKYNRGVNDAMGVSKDKKGNYVGTKSQHNEFILNKASGQNSYKNVTDVKIKSTSGNENFLDYKKKFNDLKTKLSNKTLNDKQFNSELLKLQDFYRKNGTFNDINDRISKDNIRMKTDKWAKAEKSTAMIKVFNKAVFETNKTSTKTSVKDKAFINPSDLDSDMLNYIKNNPDQFKKGQVFINGGSDLYGTSSSGYRDVYFFKDLYDYSNKISASLKENGVNFKPIYKKDGKLYMSQQLKPGDNSKHEIGVKESLKNLVEYGKHKSGQLLNAIKGVEYDGAKVNNGLYFIPKEAPEQYQDIPEQYQEEFYSNESSYSDDEISYPAPKSKTYNSQEGDTHESTPKQESTPDNSEAIFARMAYDEKIRQEDLAKEEDEINSIALDNIMSMPTYDPEVGYNMNQYKNDIPFGELGNSLGGILIGQDMANTKTPERNEKISEAYQSYISEMAEISKRGLSVEDESAAKQKISESYSLGVQALERASGGNRNVVLGNLGGLDAQRSQNLLNLSVEDAKMKMQGLQAYGEGVKYINEFDANRDIANNEREYSIAQERRRNGNDLTAAAWTNFSQTMSNYDNNKPGSMNHAMKTKFMRNAFGYDPNLKDDGKGDTKYTWSWLQKENQKKAYKSSQYKAIQDRAINMNDDEKKIFTKYLTQTASSDLDGAIRFQDYLIENRNKDGFSLDTINDPLSFYNEVFKTESQNQDFSSPIDVNTYTEGIQKSSSEFFKENPSSWENIYDKNSYHSDVNKGIPNFTENKKGIDFDSILNMANGLTTPKYNV